MKVLTASLWRTTQRFSTKPSSVFICGKEYARDDWTNVTERLLSFVSREKLLDRRYHPHNLIKQRISSHFHINYTTSSGNPVFTVIDNLSPVVTTKQNFDDLLIEPSHPSRSPNDTYYINSEFVLRTHTTAHENELIRSGLDSFLTFGDVYRRDTVDSTHFPVFHQVEGVKLLNSPTNLEEELKKTLELLVKDLFGRDVVYCWKEDYFPFTSPSWELMVEFTPGEWVEVLGCGILRPEVLSRAGAVDKFGGWAFGMGIDRLAMKLYGIEDIRLFWSTDSRFIDQFRTENFRKDIRFRPLSKHPACVFDMSFWLGEPNKFSENEFCDISRALSEDKIEKIELIDEFTKSGRQSLCYRLHYRDMHRALTDGEVRAIHGSIEQEAAKLFNVEVR